MVKAARIVKKGNLNKYMKKEKERTVGRVVQGFHGNYKRRKRKRRRSVT